jgi:hypothetical protein
MYESRLYGRVETFGHIPETPFMDEAQKWRGLLSGSF